MRTLFCLSLVLCVGAAPTDAGADDATALARHLQKLGGIDRGLCVLAGTAEGQLALAIARASRLQVFGWEPTAEAAMEARRNVDRQGLYGSRIVVDYGSRAVIPCGDNTVDLILCTQLDDAAVRQLPPAEILRALRPGGRAVLGLIKRLAGNRTLSEARLRKWLAGAKIDGVEIKSDAFGLWLTFAKPSLAGAGTWSHWFHGPDNNPLGEDRIIHSPYMTQWLAKPFFGPMPQVTTAAGGRLFKATGHIAHHQREEELLNKLTAMNGYNGIVLWQRDLPKGYMVHRSAFIATDDALYMIDGAGVLVLDAEMGTEKKRIRLDGVTGELKWIALDEGTLYALAGEPYEVKTERFKRTYAHWPWFMLPKDLQGQRLKNAMGTVLGASDVKANKTRWVHREKWPIDSRAMAAGAGKLYFYAPEKRIACLDAASGEPVWENTDKQVLALVEELPKTRGVRLAGMPGFYSSCYTLLSDKYLFFTAQGRMNMLALRTDTGKMQWHRDMENSCPTMIFRNDTLYTGLSKRWGAVTTLVDPDTGKSNKTIHFPKHACARMTGTQRELFVRGEGFKTFNFEKGSFTLISSVRPGCNDGAIPANGLLYLGPWICDCNLQLDGFVTLRSAGEFRFDVTPSAEERLQTVAEAGREVAPFRTSEKDWRTYRANNERTGSSPVPVPLKTQEKWTWTPRSAYEPGAATAAGGLIFTCGDDCRVRAIDGESGKRVWSFLAGGPVQIPPSIWNGRAYFGSNDGYIHCVEAATGKPLWRFRAAPLDRRIMVYGRVSSRWPVGSGVLVHEGVVYAAAGIIDYDGTTVCALDAGTGKLKWQNVASGHLNEKTRQGVSVAGHLTVADGKLWMAGGNMATPAVYDLADGKCLNRKPADNVRALYNHGEDVCIFGGAYVLTGGRKKYSPPREMVSSDTFMVSKVSWGAPYIYYSHVVKGQEKQQQPAYFLRGRVAPAWDSKTFIARDLKYDGISSWIRCFDSKAIEDHLAKLLAPEAIEKEKTTWAMQPNMAGLVRDKNRRKWPEPRWQADLPPKVIAHALVVTPNAVLMTLDGGPKHRSDWSLVAFDAATGTRLWEHALPSAPRIGGLLVDRDGRTVVVLVNGTILCYGS